ncbi:AtpZ/AtpI family protein [uncultured Ezakiella sp.]|uniref:AtpZ/AtpI family protein n=1 Tax=uncultured Ezakiella sp. TaxID=1637529 RepID=UPI0025E18972|nr:AtpZ/AtpI family protein [uncultured Ezakiella sp.]
MKHLKYLTFITQLGLNLVTSILLGCFIGYLLDKLFNLDNVFFIIFMILGLISGLFSAYLNLKNVINKENKKTGEDNE